MEFLRSLLTSPGFYIILVIYLLVTYFVFGSVDPYRIVKHILFLRNVEKKTCEDMKEDNTSSMDYFDECKEFLMA